MSRVGDIMGSMTKMYGARGAQTARPCLNPSRELTDERQVRISLREFEQQGECPVCYSTACDGSCGVEWPVLDAKDDENRTFEDEHESNTKKQRVEASKDGHEATDRVGGGLYMVSAQVDREARWQNGGASQKWRDGLREALQMLEAVRGQPIASHGTQKMLADKLDNVAKGLRRHQEDPRCAEHNPNCAFKKGRRFNGLCLGIDVAREALEQARGVPDAPLMEALGQRLRAEGVLDGDERHDAVKARKILRLATQMTAEARRSLEQGRAASHYASPEAPPPLARRVSPLLVEAAEAGEAGAPGGGASGSTAGAAGAAAGAALPPVVARQPSAPVKKVGPYGPEKELPRDIAQLLGRKAGLAVAQAMRLHASGTVRRIYMSDWKGRSEGVRAVALFLAHKHLHAHRPDLAALGLPPPLELGAYGVAVRMPAKSAAASVRKCVTKAFEAGVGDGAVEGSF